MTTEREPKINRLLSTQPLGVVFSTAWLSEQGYSLDLQQQYKRSQWFDSIGKGALIRHNDQVDYLGGIYALQKHLGSTVHPAGKTALALQGKAHYLELSTKRVQLFGGKDENLPRWFKKRDWGLDVGCKLTSFLPPELGLVEIEHKSFKINISSPARAVMECLYLAPKAQPLLEAFELMEGLNNLRPAIVQQLLKQCNSIKVKRLFLYMADKAGHDWFDYLDISKVDQGSGKRSLVESGVYVPKYQITVPKELEVGHE